MRGSARRFEEMRGDTRRCKVIKGDTRRCGEIRSWLWGMALRFIVFPWRHHQVSRVRTWHWGMLFRFILPLRRHQFKGRDARRFKGDTRRCGGVQQDARRCEVIREV